MAGVIIDRQDNVVLNFLKWNHACRASRCWVLDSYFKKPPALNPPTPAPILPDPIISFDLAWKYCRDPFWMLWALDKFYDPFFPVVPNVDGKFGGIQARTYAMATFDPATATGAVVFPLLSIKARIALSTLINYIRAAPPVPASDLAAARLTVQQELGSQESASQLNKTVRAHSALLAAFDCADGNDFDAASRAWGLATEVVHWAEITEYRPDWSNWWEDRENLAYNLASPGVHDAFGLFDPTTPPGSNLVTALKNRYGSPPPWAKNTNHSPRADPAATTGPVFSSRRHDGYGIGQPAAATPPANWIGTKLKNNPTNWYTYGTNDDGTPTSLSSWVTDTSNNLISNGNYVSPIGSYNWGFQYAGLTPGQTVVLYVQWTYSGPTTVTDNVTTVVANPP
jgi:hypothetical protein